MNKDNAFRWVRYIEAESTTDFQTLVDGWLELAEEQTPREAKALLEGDYLAYLPDGTRFKEVTFKTEHASVQNALPDWARSTRRRFGWVEEDAFVRSDGDRFTIDQIRFVRIEDDRTGNAKPRKKRK